MDYLKRMKRRVRKREKRRIDIALTQEIMLDGWKLDGISRIIVFVENFDTEFAGDYDYRGIRIEHERSHMVLVHGGSMDSGKKLLTTNNTIKIIKKQNYYYDKISVCYEIE